MGNLIKFYKGEVKFYIQDKQYGTEEVSSIFSVIYLILKTNLYLNLFNNSSLIYQYLNLLNLKTIQLDVYLI